ncbi:MAG: DUF3291 domain-containing protein [Leptolyngbyaceae cyanobacterium bins.349]|nr:DUF3291 domain-containing protein [Leptolyngbyaceae cyanobacterium bins.349]
MAFVSITRLRLRSPLYLLPFFRYAIPSAQQSATAPGNLITQTRRVGLTAYWTLTVWEDEASMRRYMTSGSHREAMPKLAQWCDEASTVHWVQETTTLPTWEEIQQRMMTQGRLYPVKYPSSHHAAGVIQL